MEQTVDLSFEERLVDSLGAIYHDVRADYKKGFLNLGFPHKKDEEYKFTYVRKFVEKNLNLENLSLHTEVDGNKIKEHFIKLEGHHIVFVNGMYSEELSMTVADETSLVELTDYGDIDKHNKMLSDSFVALNSAFSKSALQFTVPKNHTSRPVFIYQIIDNQGSVVALPKINIKALQGSSIDVFEKTIVLGESPSFINKVMEVEVAKNASVNISKLQQHPRFIYEVDGIFAYQHRDSRFYANTFTFSGGLIRNNLNIDLDEEHCESHMHGLYLISGNSHVDNHTTVDHKFANSMSNELYKGIVDEKAQAVFNGKIYVRPDAQQTNAFQSNNNISLSEAATIHTKPQLEIWADDVKCSHGCTIGQLDEEAIFYLRARGIDERSAKAMMLVAFAEESFEYIPFDFLKEDLHQIIENRLIHS